MTDLSPRKGMTKAEIEVTVEAILAAATLEEKVAMMSGKGFFRAMKEDKMRWGARPYRAGAGCERLGVPTLWFTDGPRGVARGSSTCFPVTMARGASWDRDLERRVGEVIGIEARAGGCNLSGAVCVNLLRHPGWGRAQETYGEDPYHMGELGAALAQGIQSHNVIATVKHFALNSIENARFKVDVRIDDRTLREVYLPHFKRILDAGCASVMSAYNKMNGEYCGQHHELLTKILRDEWGFDGFVHSDWILGVYQPYGAAAGLDIENPEPVHFGKRLVDAVTAGQIAPDVVTTACRRILRTLYRFLCAEDPLASYPPELMAAPAHAALAREVAEKSAVLLKNSGVLPLKKSARVAIFGRLADKKNTGDNGSSRVDAPYVVTALAGLRDYLNMAQLECSGDESDGAAAARVAAGFDAAIIVVGLTAVEEGEFIPGNMGAPEGAAPADAGGGSGALGAAFDRGGDRTILTLPEDQIALIKAVSAANRNTIVVLVAGSAILVSEWAPDVGAILQTFYAGMEGGSALARLLYGEVSPSGKLPFTVAMRESDYPFFDKNADHIEYGPLHGYTLFSAEQKTPQFAFGFGLSYAQFTYRALNVRRLADGLDVSVAVTNSGAVVADEIAQLYLGFPGKVVVRPEKLLRGFARLSLSPGETGFARFHVPEADLQYWDSAAKIWRLEPGRTRIFAGPNSRDKDLLTTDIIL
jgi:beta-glucosidase